MISLERAMANDRTMKALTGVSVQEFKMLCLFFSDIWYEFLASKKGRKRDVGGGRKGVLQTIEKKLFFIL